MHALHQQTGFQQNPFSSPAPRPHLKQHLESISLAMTDLINAQNFTLAAWSPLLAPSFRGSPGTSNGHPSPPLRCTRQEFVTFMADVLEKYPKWECRVLDLNSEVEGNAGTVWQNLETKGLPSEEIITRSFVEITFRRERKGGRWRAVGFVGAHGGIGLDGGMWL